MATKVLPFNLFTGEQKNISAKDEPIHIAASPDVVLIATKQGKIQVYERNNDSPLLFEFNTKNPTIYDLQYMNENGYVITIEKEREQSAINVIRIYTNWRDLPQQYDLTDATSSLTPVKSGVSLKEVQNIVPERYKLLVYTLPLPSSVQSMSVCPISNYIAACTEKVISIYSAKLNCPIEWVLDVKVDEVKKVVFYDRYLAYYTDKEVFALKMKIEKVSDKQPIDFTDLSQMAKEVSQPQQRDSDTMHSVAFKNIEIASRKLTLSRANSQTFGADDKSGQKYSYYEEDEQYVECVFDDSQIIPWVNINVPSLAQINAATFASINAPKEILGPIKDVHIVSVNVEDNFRLRSSSVMYYKRLAQNESIQQICLVPEYLDQAGAKNKLSGMRLLVSTTRLGTLFDISNNTHHIITFNYSDDIIDCVASPMFLYSITDTGLEIFAMRATRSNFDDNSMPTTKPCIIGIQPFNGLKTLVVEKDTLVLMCLISEAALLRKMSQKIDVKGITKSPAKKEDVMGWNIYTLKHTTTADIFNQISRKAETSRDNQTVEYQLLLEARALVSSALSSSQDKQAESEQQPLTTLLKYCNGLLAGYCLRTDNYSNSTSLFFQSEVRPMDVCNQFVEKIKTGVSEESSTSSKRKFDDPIMSLHTAFDQYLNSALFANDGTFEFNEEDEFMANLILDHYCRFNPFKLGKVILESSLNNYNKEVAINYLEKAEQDKNLAEISLWEMKIALVVLYLACDYRDKALTLLNKIPQNLLVYYCSQNPKLLDAGEHTLGKALRECAPWTLLEILVRVDYKQVPSRKPVKQNRFSSTLGLLANVSHLEQLEQQLQELSEQRQLLQKQLEAQKDQSQQLQDLNDQISQLKQMQKQQEEQIQHYKTEGSNEDNSAQSNVAELVQTPSKSSLFAFSPLTKKRLNNELKFKNESRILSMCYLEALLIEKSKQHAQSPSKDLEREIEVLFTRLSKVYYEILLLTDVEEIENLFHQICSVASDQETDSAQGKKLSFEYIWKYFHVHCFNAFPRHKWLEQLAPLSENLNQPMQALKTPEGSANSSPTASMKNIEMVLGFTEQQLRADHFYLRKFQTILSSDIPRNGEEVIALIDSEYQQKDYLLFSLRVLCLPRVNKLPEGVNALITSTPHVIIDYLKHYCHQKEDWAIVLNTLWQAAVNLESKLSNEPPSAADEELINQYTIILNHTAKQLSPDEFLALLPVDGDLKFFLPFIETNFRLYKSNKLLNRIQKQALKEQEEQ